ncbi:MAG TPA: DivIVA domain-containing protein [Mycobacteriales bacterium]|nr:DivIVA domain-containing protein [Mycobacteriales bacterium]
MLVVLILCLVVLVLAGVVVAVLRGDEPLLQDVERDLPGDGMPTDRPMTSDDVDGLKFSVALRGYRMAEVDDALSRLAHELAERDATIGRLQAAGEATPVTEQRAPDDASPGGGTEPAMETGTAPGSGGVSKA